MFTNCKLTILELPLHKSLFRPVTNFCEVFIALVLAAQRAQTRWASSTPSTFSDFSFMFWQPAYKRRAMRIRETGTRRDGGSNRNRKETRRQADVSFCKGPSTVSTSFRACRSREGSHFLFSFICLVF